ncbi:haloacid dehalogenase [Xylaria palmicola]|nr:haloacid dehalogenase [Xylaria palmicola]
MPPSVEELKDIKALTFDVFGTVVEWRETVTGELVKTARAKIASPAFSQLPEPLQSSFQQLSSDDWARLAEEWRAGYGAFTWGFVPGETEWKDIDTHHYESLKELLEVRGVAGAYTDEEARSLSLVWHRLRPWNDSAQGIQRLGTRYVTATLSNGNRSLLADLDAHGSLGFQRIISAADFGAYKPHPRTYLGAVDALGRRPNEVAMVAAHLGDLRAARGNGLRTIYVEREGEEEWSPDDERWVEAREWVDLEPCASDLRALSEAVITRRRFSQIHEALNAQMRKEEIAIALVANAVQQPQDGPGGVSEREV